MGKGSKARPFSVDRKTFDDRWDQIFSKGKEQTPAKSTFDGETKNIDTEEEGSEIDTSRSVGV